MSNTFGLEFNRNWSGLCIDFDEEYVDRAKLLRKSKIVCCDLLKTDINDLLERESMPNEIDYMSLDVDDATEKVLDDINFHKYKFKIITYEHNLFQAQGTSDQIHSEEHKSEVIRLHKKSREKFKSHGYRLLFGNVALMGFGYVEDWYVNPYYFDEECLNRLESSEIRCEEVIKKLLDCSCLLHPTSH
jgi:hypothetical protein